MHESTWGGQAGRWRAHSPCLLWRDSLWLCFLRTCCGACSTEKETNRQRPHRRQRAMHASAARSTLACAEVHARRMCRLRAVHMRLHASTEPVHRQYTCTRGAPALRQPAYSYPCRRPRSHPRRLGHGEGHGVAARLQAHDARGCSLQLPRAWLRVAGSRLRVAGCSLPTTRGCKLQGWVAPRRSPSVVASQ